MSELVVCVPGPWRDRGHFLRQVITLEPQGRYLFAGMILMEMEANENVALEPCGVDPKMGGAFETAGQGKIPAEIVARVGRHASVVYLHFPLDLPGKRKEILSASRLLQRLGGIAVKLESAGIAHTWEHWFALLSGNSFDAYRAAVVLVGDKSHYYSCGMHHFGLPDCEVPCSLPAGEAAALMNDFNFWRIAERPRVADGHTFSQSEATLRFRLLLLPDARHSEDALFRNPHGVWRLSSV